MCSLSFLVVQPTSSGNNCVHEGHAGLDNSKDHSNLAKYFMTTLTALFDLTRCTTPAGRRSICVTSIMSDEKHTAATIRVETGREVVLPRHVGRGG